MSLSMMIPDTEAAKDVTKEQYRQRQLEESPSVPKGWYEATITDYTVPEKRYDSETNAGSTPIETTFQCYDVPTGKFSKVTIRLQTADFTFATKNGGTMKDKGRSLAEQLINTADVYDVEGFVPKLEKALDWARTNRIKIRVSEFTSGDRVRNGIEEIRAVK